MNCLDEIHLIEFSLVTLFYSCIFGGYSLPTIMSQLENYPLGMGVAFSQLNGVLVL